MQGTTIFLAGSEIEKLSRALLENGVRWILFSYYYVVAFNKAEWINRIQEEYPHVKWFLDSGAFTYASQAKTGKKLPPPRKYVKQYMDYIQDTGHRWCRIAEADLDEINGMDISREEVEGWLEEMLVRFPDYPIMPTWHHWRGRSKWTEYCQDPRVKVLAIGSGGGTPVGVQRKMVLEAREARKPVHGFAMTKVNTVLKWVPYDSVDSTSVWMGQKYGSLPIFTNNKWKVLDGDHKNDRRQYRKYFTNIGCDYRLIEKDDLTEVRKASVIAWRNLAERFHLLKMRRDSYYKMGAFGVGTEDVGEGEAAAIPVAPHKPPLTREETGDIPVNSTRRTPIERNSEIQVSSLQPNVPIIQAEVAPTRPRPLARFGVPIDDPTRKRARPQER